MSRVRIPSPAPTPICRVPVCLTIRRGDWGYALADRSRRCLLRVDREWGKRMRALQYTAFGQAPEIREVPTPQPGVGEVLVKMTAAGVCHSDEYFMSLPPDEFTTALPLTLGHEGAGIVAQLGSAANGIKEGDPVAVYGAWGCGSCRACASGAENYCVEDV